MDRFNLKIRKELLDRIKLMARYYNISTTKMIIQLLEIGYLKMISKTLLFDDFCSDKNQIFFVVFH